MEFFTKTGMGREKRPFEMESAREGMDDGKRSRPALARVIVDAVKMDSVQTVCSSLEPLLRKVVSLLLSIVVSKSIFWDKIPARFMCLL
jgi:ABC-type thiamine transport system ATPase subunit